MTLRYSHLAPNHLTSAANVLYSSMSFREQVRQIAIERMKRTTHTMTLEDQQLQVAERQKMLQAMIEDLVREMPKELWSAKS